MLICDSKSTSQGKERATFERLILPVAVNAARRQASDFSILHVLLQMKKTLPSHVFLRNSPYSMTN